MAAAAAGPIAIAVPTAALAYLIIRKLAGRVDGPHPHQSALLAEKGEQAEDYGDLDSLVSYSSRVIAAARAVESARPDAFVRDPLAEALAGDKALALARARAAAAAVAEKAAGAAADSGDPAQSRAVPRLVMRTAFLDDAVMVAALGGAVGPGGGGGSAAASRLLSSPGAAAALAPLASHVRAFAAAPDAPPVFNLQVVMLGAGMDARPWRLALPPGRVRWIEVDREDVIAAKRRALEAAGAEVPPPAAPAPAAPPSRRGSAAQSRGKAAGLPPPPPPLVAASPSMRPASPVGGGGGGGSGSAAPKPAAAAAAATTPGGPPSPPPPPVPPLPRRPSAPVSFRSLRRTSSAAAAAAALGLFPGGESAPPAPPKFPLRPYAWAAVAADVTVPGWTAALAARGGGGFDPRVPTLWVAEGLLYYLDPAAVPGMLAEAASVSAPGSALVATVITDAALAAMRQRRREEEQGGGATGGAPRAVVSAAAAAASAAPPSAPSKKEADKGPGGPPPGAGPAALTSKFVWGAPAGDTDGYFLRSGWRTLQRPAWGAAAAAYGWRPERRAAAAGGGGPGGGAAAPAADDGQVQFLVAAVADK